MKYKQKWVKLVDDLMMMSPAKASVFPRSSPLQGSFRAEETRETRETSTAAKSKERRMFLQVNDDDETNLIERDKLKVI